VADVVRPLEPILFTRDLPSSYQAILADTGLQWLCEPMISTEIVADFSHIPPLYEGLEKPNVVVTSQNGATALIQFLQHYPEYRLRASYFAVGLKTRNTLFNARILAYKPKIHDANGLSDFLIEQASRNKRPVIHFHGDKALDTLPIRLNEAGLTVKRALVYHTHLLKADLTQLAYNSVAFNSVAFMSPTAVESFATNGGFSKPLNYVFSIGPTTAVAVAEYVQDGIALGGNEYNFERLVQLIANYNKSLCFSG